VEPFTATNYPERCPAAEQLEIWMFKTMARLEEWMFKTMMRLEV
jgi:hypothetical protein